MKSTISFILSLLLCLSIVQVNAKKCWEHTNPLKPWEKTMSECGSQDVKQDLNALNSPSVVAPEDAFKITFSCIVSNQSLCGKAENSFKAAGQTIAKLIKFNTPITVNATFADFCRVLGECGGKILGAANAARTVPLLDDDNIIRQYPQALAKQFPLSPAPKFGPFDIQAFFNAESPLFFGEGNIQPDEFDFQYIIMHEFIHGLGFASGWNNYFSDTPVALTPDPSFIDTITTLTEPVNYTGFDQTAFDKYMVNAKIKTKSPVRMSDLAVEINNFTTIGKIFPNIQDLLDTFASSPQFTIAKTLIEDSQTPFTFAFQPQNATSTDDLVFLETNLDPFQQGSSISHMNAVVFTNSTDFLEVFNAVRGKSLDQILTASGGTFPIGPKLQSVLETLGYTTDNNPNPYQPRLPDSTPSQTPNIPSPLPVGNNTASVNSTSSTGSGGSGYGTGSGSGSGSGSGGSSSGGSGTSSIMGSNDANFATSLTSSFSILIVFVITAVTLVF